MSLRVSGLPFAPPSFSHTLHPPPPAGPSGIVARTQWRVGAVSDTVSLWGKDAATRVSPLLARSSSFSPAVGAPPLSPPIVVERIAVGFKRIVEVDSQLGLLLSCSC